MSARLPSLRFAQPLRQVRLVAPPTSQETFEAQMQDREQAAYERGRLDGEKALSEQLVKQRAELAELQNGVLTALRQAVPQVLRDTEQAVTALALEVAQKLVAGLPLSADMVAAAVREALAQVEESTETHIYLHVEDLALLQQVNAELLRPPPGSPPLHFHPTPEVTRGGCLVRTRFGVVDGQRETKLELLKKSLLP